MQGLIAQAEKVTLAAAVREADTGPRHVTARTTPVFDRPLYWLPFGPSLTAPMFQLIFWAVVWLLIWKFVGFNPGPPDPVLHGTIG